MHRGPTLDLILFYNNDYTYTTINFTDPFSVSYGAYLYLNRLRIRKHCLGKVLKTLNFKQVPLWEKSHILTWGILNKIQTRFIVAPAVHRSYRIVSPRRTAHGRPTPTSHFPLIVPVGVAATEGSRRYQ